MTAAFHTNVSNLAIPDTCPIIYNAMWVGLRVNPHVMVARVMPRRNNRYWFKL